MERTEKIKRYSDLCMDITRAQITLFELIRNMEDDKYSDEYKKLEKFTNWLFRVRRFCLNNIESNKENNTETQQTTTE